MGKKFSEIKSLFKKCIEKAADANYCPKSDVTVKQFWETANGVLTEWEIRRIGGFTALRNAEYPKDYEAARVEKFVRGIAEKKEKKYTHISLNTAAFFAMLEEFADRVFRGRVQALPKKKLKKVARTLVALWSDHHFGSDIKKRDTSFQDYQRPQEARRLASLVKQICEYKVDHRDETELLLFIVGDMIQNQLHDRRDGAAMAEQSCRAVHLLIQAILHLAQNFGKVTVKCTPGNHGRFKERHQERAIHEKWDAMEMVIYYAVRSALRDIPNVSFELPYTPFITAESQGHKLFATHGDTVMNPGRPEKNIQVERLDFQINRINASLPDANEYMVFAMGHVHTPCIVRLSSGAAIITNGALVPTDSFMTSLGILEAHCGQWIWETTKDHAIGDARFIRVGLSDDENPELDKIISPWKSF